MSMGKYWFSLQKGLPVVLNGMRTKQNMGDAAVGDWNGNILPNVRAVDQM